MKKILALLMAAVMLMSLAACGRTAPDENAGLYEAVYASVMGLEIDVVEVFSEGLSIELKSGGKGSLHTDGNDYSFTWTVQDDVFYAKANDVQLKGTLSNGIMELEDVAGSGVDVTLIDKSRVDMEDLSLDEAALKRAEQDAWWTGLWYGWIIYDKAGGQYAEWKDMAYDVVAEISSVGLVSSIEMWWYNTSPNDAFASIVGHLEKGSTDRYKFVAETAATSADLFGADKIVVDPADSYVRDIEHMIELRGEYGLDSEAEDYYSYYIFLRPWGDVWDDLKETEIGRYPYTNMMPVHYDWYLEMVEQGLDPRETSETASMREAAAAAARRIVGYWEASGFVYTFNEDGTGSYSYGSGAMNFKYTVDGSTLSLSYSNNNEPVVTTFSIEGDVLTIKDALGVDVSYAKRDEPPVPTEEETAEGEEGNVEESSAEAEAQN